MFANSESKLLNYIVFPLRLGKVELINDLRAYALEHTFMKSSHSNFEVIMNVNRL